MCHRVSGVWPPEWPPSKRHPKIVAHSLSEFKSDGVLLYRCERLVYMGSKIRLVFVAALCWIAVSCGNSDPLAVTTSTIEAAEETSSELETDAAEQELDDRDGTFDPANWVDAPKWWSEAEEIYDRNPNLLFQQRTQLVETPPNDSLASEMHLGDQVLKWPIPEGWQEVCSSGDCVYTLQGSDQGTRGFVAGWGGSKSRVVNGTGPDHNALVLGDPLSYVDGETQPLSCEPSNEKLDVEAVDLYPEPWFVACVGMVDGFSIARVEMFRLNKDCEPYGNSYGAWISWEWASAANINNFVEGLSLQMSADRIECVSLERLLSLKYVNDWNDDAFEFWFGGAVDKNSGTIWVSELQRRIGAGVDGFYGPQTQGLHFRAAKSIDSSPDNIPLISSTPCGTFKLVSDVQQWEALDGLVMEWDRDQEKWINGSGQLEPPDRHKSDEGNWWYRDKEWMSDRKGKDGYPPYPNAVWTADVTGDGVNEFVMLWSNGSYSTTVVATNHKQSVTCEPWRYIGEPYLLNLSLAPDEHDVWLASAKTYDDAQGNRCQNPTFNVGYVWYDEDADNFVPTVCYSYKDPNK